MADNYASGSTTTGMSVNPVKHNTRPNADTDWFCFGLV